MRLQRCAFIATVLFAAGILVGCSSHPTGMKNMNVPGGPEGKSSDVNLKSKGGNIKEVPPLPPEPQAPPLPTKK
jgi:hypothetical protein